MGRISRKLSRFLLLARAIKPAVDFYQGSWSLAMHRVAGVFNREGVGGILRRAAILDGRPLTETRTADPSTVYGDVPPLMTDFTPKISVIVPNFNHAKYLRQRLDSIYRQTYQNIEVILLDDCSTDGSLAILREYVTRYADRTIYHFNEANSGGVFHQWKKGMGLATGELVWIAESDDYCSENFLAELVRCFQNQAVKLAFSRTSFVRGDSREQTWSTEEYMKDIGLAIWQRPFIRSAHAMVKAGWATKNLVPNVSSAVFRHPGRLDLLSDRRWLSLRLCGDWAFYLSIMRGGLVAFSPYATNYYRQHPQNTSVNAQTEDIYYREHEIVASYLAVLYRVERADLKRQEQYLYSHWCSQRGDDRRAEFTAIYDIDRAWSKSDERRPNLVMAVYALTAGGGETFPIMLANQLERKGYSVTLFNCREQLSEPGVRAMLSPTIPLLELERLELAGEAFADMGVELVHSHHAWVDVSLATCLLAKPDIKHVVTMHGMYEMMTSEQLQRLRPVLQRGIDAFVYTAEKNLAGIPVEIRDRTYLCRIDNALPDRRISPVSRDELQISEHDFIVCLVARAIPEKGWEEAIRAVTWANHRSARKIHLLLIGEGPEFDRLRSEHPSEHVKFLGFRANIRDFFAASDIGLLPSRFKGESAPLVLIDCLHSGRPVLASNVGEIRCMLDAGGNIAGELFDLNNWDIDVEALGQIILSLANDPHRYQELVDRVPGAVAKFEIAAMLEKYEHVYKVVLGPASHRFDDTVMGN